MNRDTKRKNKIQSLGLKTSASATDFGVASVRVETKCGWDRANVSVKFTGVSEKDFLDEIFQRIYEEGKKAGKAELQIDVKRLLNLH